MIAATPSSPTYLSIVQLNISVMMPLTSAVAISEQPFVTALPSVWGRQTGLTKWSRLFRLENTSRPTMAVMEYPRPVATAAPPIPQRKTAINR